MRKKGILYGRMAAMRGAAFFQKHATSNIFLFTAEIFVLLLLTNILSSFTRNCDGIWSTFGSVC